MSRALAFIAVLAALGYAALCAVLFISQRSLIYFPQPRLLDSAGVTATLHSSDASLKLTIRAAESAHALIYFGGNAEDVSINLPSLSAAFPNHALYLLHYRSYGGSSGKPSEAALHEDALALFDMVAAKHSHITVIGRSLGSGVAIRLASVRPVSRLVLVTPFYSMLELAVRQFPFVPVQWLLKDKFESWRYAPSVRVPTTIVVAENDEIIPVESSLRLAAHFAAGIAEIKVIRGVGHNTISNNPEYAKALTGPP